MNGVPFSGWIVIPGLMPRLRCGEDELLVVRAQVRAVVPAGRPNLSRLARPVVGGLPVRVDHDRVAHVVIAMLDRDGQDVTDQLQLRRQHGVIGVERDRLGNMHDRSTALRHQQLSVAQLRALTLGNVEPPCEDLRGVGSAQLLIALQAVAVGCSTVSASTCVADARTSLPTSSDGLRCTQVRRPAPRARRRGQRDPRDGSNPMRRRAPAGCRIRRAPRA